MKTYTGRSGINLHEGMAAQVLKCDISCGKRGSQKLEHPSSVFRTCLNTAVPKVVERI